MKLHAHYQRPIVPFWEFTAISFNLGLLQVTGSGTEKIVEDIALLNEKLGFGH